jgi:hypothetical protein
MPLVNKGRTIENSATTILARSVKPDGSPRLPADVTALTLRVYENKTGTLVVPEGEDEETYEGTDLTVADVILDPVVTADDDVRWTDDEGYNVRLDLHGSHFPEGGKVYQVELKVTPATGDPGYLLWQITTENIWSE